MLELEDEAVFAALGERGELEAEEVVAVVEEHVDDVFTEVFEGQLVVDAEAAGPSVRVRSVDGVAAVGAAGAG